MWKIIWPVLSVLAAVGIFFSSSLPGDISGGASMAIAEMVRYFAPEATDETISLFNFIVRKGAHFTVYFVLAFCVAHSLKFHLSRRSVLFLTVWGIASVYGIVDEAHQYFVPGRVMAVMDMVINSVGAAAGAGFVCWWISRASRASMASEKS